MKVPKPKNSNFGYPWLNTSMRYKSLCPKIRWCYQQPFWNWRRNCLQTCVISIRIHVREKKMNIKGKNRLFFNDLSIIYTTIMFWKKKYTKLFKGTKNATKDNIYIFFFREKKNSCNNNNNDKDLQKEHQQQRCNLLQKNRSFLRVFFFFYKCETDF